MEKLKVGDRLYIVRTDGKRETEGYSKITKVGTKFFYIDVGGREEKVPLTITFPHNFNHYLTIYLTKEDWEERKFREKFHWALSGALNSRKLKDIPLEKLKEVAGILELWQA